MAEAPRGLLVLPLVCPDCGRALSGLCYDRIFFCLPCRQGLSPARGEWQRHKLLIARPEKEAPPAAFYLPFWEFPLKVRAVPASGEQTLALRALGEFTTAWVSGFSTYRASYFGDIGFKFTERKAVPRQAEGPAEGRFVLGCSRSLEDALVYPRLFVSLLIDRKVDITGLELEVEPGQPALWAIPCARAGEEVVELVLGTRLPAIVVEDLEEMTGLSRQAGRAV